MLESLLSHISAISGMDQLEVALLLLLFVTMIITAVVCRLSFVVIDSATDQLTASEYRIIR